MCKYSSGSVEPKPEQTGGQGGGGHGAVSLVIPCKAEYVGISRLVAGAVGNQESLDKETIADIKLVVSEACACFVERSDEERSGSAATTGGAAGGAATTGEEAPGSLRVDFNVTPESWEITVSDPEHRCHIVRLGHCDPMSEGGLGLTIINALVDRVEQTDSEGRGSILRLVKRLTPRTTPGD